jgi:hypothetical protein
VAAGDYAEACPKLEESQRLDPSGGTLVNLALCHEQIGRTASAWAEFKEVFAGATREGREQRARIAKEHIAALEPRLSRIVIAPIRPVPKMEVLIDGVSLREAAWGLASPFDPGNHEVEGRAPGYETFHSSFNLLDNGDHAEIRIPQLVALPVAKDATVGGAAHGQRTAGIILLASGGAALAAGAVFGTFAISKRSESNRFCTTDTDCTSQGVSLNKTAITYSWVSTATIGAGAIAAALGIYLVLTDREKAPPKTATSLAPWLGLGSAGAALTGDF